uniref:WAS protein family homolog 1 n=1 Tax=Zeugodacus cucurbitae TaxID=28588 RepID=A0A0A1XD07_ZEUCU
MYTVPVIPPDLRHEETIIQAAIALSCLQKTINSVFDCIDNRTQRNNAKVQELSARVGRAQAKIRSLVGTKKAIKIYAPARFPSTQVFHDIPQTFGNSKTMLDEHVKNQNNEKQQQNYEVLSRIDAPATQALQEKLVFFHVRYKDMNESFSGHSVTANKLHVNKSIGMGIVPEKLRSVSSLLHCNGSEMVYSQENGEKETWKKAKLFKLQRQRQDNLELKHLLEPAPYSLAHRNQKTNSFGGLRYTPRLNEAPEIDLPLDLPDLPGIADDIQFEGKDHQQIAPSLYIENLPDLPELEEAATTEGNISKSNEEHDIKQNHSIQPPTANAVIATTIVNVAQVSVAPAPPPPPPPPPLPPPHAVAKPMQTNAVKENSNLQNTNTDNARNELMDAIRKAGGARGGRLRAAAAAPVDVVDNRLSTKNCEAKPATNKIGGGDLMADLHNKLLMRRKGISGSKDKENSDGVNTVGKALKTSTDNPVMSRLSALIPPPTARKNSDDDDDTHDEDNDTDWVE